jgi:hypothetical protein
MADPWPKKAKCWLAITRPSLDFLSKYQSLSVVRFVFRPTTRHFVIIFCSKWPSTNIYKPDYDDEQFSLPRLPSRI